MSRDRAQWFEIAALVAKGAPVDYRIALDSLPRIAPLLRRASGEASGRFRFHRYVEEEPLRAASFDAADGRVSATLVLTCQRCLEDTEVHVAADCHLAFVEDEDAAVAVPASHDPVVMTKGRVSLAELVEEELLLSMPAVPVHADPGECERRAARHTPAEAPGATAEPTHRPFAGLRDLMKK